MTLNEFKAWFEGFTESMEGAPTESQFEKIKAKLAEIDDKPIERQVFVDRYYHHWPKQWWESQPVWQPYVTCSVGAGQEGDTVGSAVLSMSSGDAVMSAMLGGGREFVSMNDMRSLGRAEAA